MIQDFLESLGKVLHKFYNHQEVIPVLIKSNITATLDRTQILAFKRMRIRGILKHRKERIYPTGSLQDTMILTQIPPCYGKKARTDIPMILR